MGSLRALLSFQNFPLSWTFSNILMLLLTPAALPSRGNKRLSMLLLPPSVLSLAPRPLSYSSAPRSSKSADFGWREKKASQKLLWDPFPWSSLSCKYSFYSLFLHSPASPYLLFPWAWLPKHSVFPPISDLPSPLFTVSVSSHHQQTASVAILHFLLCHW